MNANKYYYIGKLHAQNTLMYFVDFLISAGLVIMIMFILISLWKVLYTGRPLIAGFDIAQMVWYLALTESLVFMPLRSIIHEIENDIKSGFIAHQLTKPYNYFIAKFSSTAGFALLRFIVVFISAMIMAYIFVGPIQFNILGILFGIINVLLAFILSFLIAIGIAMLAFWLEESFAFYFIYDKMRFIMGGFLFPLEILPIWLEIPARYLPFSALLYYPAKVFVDFSFPFFLKALVFQISWILIFMIILSLFYKKAIKKVSIHGG